jgi:hypothetical protein
VLLERSRHRLVWTVALAAVIAGVCLIPSPPPASAGVCDVPVISTVCSVVGSVASGIYDGTKWTVDLSSGAVKLGGKVVGTVVSKGGGFLCKTFGGDYWTAKACNWIANKVGGSVATKVSGSGSGSGSGGVPPGTTTAQVQELQPKRLSELECVTTILVVVDADHGVVEHVLSLPRGGVRSRHVLWVIERADSLIQTKPGTPIANLGRITRTA